jgi:hypothetical protein
MKSPISPTIVKWLFYIIEIETKYRFLVLHTKSSPYCVTVHGGTKYIVVVSSIKENIYSYTVATQL